MKWPNGDDDTYVFVEHCMCISCDRIRVMVREMDGPLESFERFNMSTFPFGCERCGNKRCPHHSYHGLRCTGSNEPGQKGSIYE